MKPLGLWECLVLVSFWVAGLAGFLVGGTIVLGYVVLAFLWTGFGWVAYQLYREYEEQCRIAYRRRQLFSDWAKRQHHLKGMD